MVVANAAPGPGGPVAGNSCLSDCAHVSSLLQPRLAHVNAASREDLSQDCWEGYRRQRCPRGPAQRLSCRNYLINISDCS